jgi:hypothetical protein
MKVHDARSVQRIMNCVFCCCVLLADAMSAFYDCSGSSITHSRNRVCKHAHAIQHQSQEQCTVLKNIVRSALLASVELLLLLLLLRYIKAYYCYYAAICAKAVAPCYYTAASVTTAVAAAAADHMCKDSR